MPTTPTSDLRLRAHAFGLRCASLSHAYRLLEGGDAAAEATFTAIQRHQTNPTSNTWGVLTAFTAGINNQRISVEVST